MNENDPSDEDQGERPRWGQPQRREPIFNPGVFDAVPVLVLVLSMLAVQSWAHYGGIQAQADLYREYAFYSGRFWRGSDLSALVSYAFLHGDWMHLAMNGFAAFALGTVCWRAMGTARFYLFFAITAAAGAIAFALVRPEDGPLVGASGAIFGFLAAFKYIQFQKLADRGHDIRRDALMFLIQVSVLNFAIGIATGGVMAWEAHFGGLAVGWFLTPTMLRKD